VKELLATVPGMTPARFELLYVLRRLAILNGPNHRPKVQMDLWKNLGLHRSTVCKLLKELEGLGWVHRQRCEDDRQTFEVTLTEEGLRMIWRAMRRVFRQKILKREYQRLLGPRKTEPWDEFLALYDPEGQPPPPTWKTTRDDGQPMHVTEIVHDVYRTIHRIARFFGDSSAVWFDLGNKLPPGRRPYLVPRE
jgi:DNA-binding MarR family transcriptional regulator